MKKSTKTFYTVVSLFMQYTSYSNEIITFFLQPYPISATNELGKKTVNKLKKPGKIAQHSLNGILKPNTTAGIFATYGGYLDVSNDTGQLEFPRRHEETEVNLIITNKITPSVMSENTLSHWELSPGTPAEMYTMQRKQDEASELFYWDLQKKELPENNVIPLKSIILFAKPKHVYVPTGITVANNKPNLILPDIYIKKGIKILPNTLYVLNIKHFFSPLEILYKKNNNSYIKHLAP